MENELINIDYYYKRGFFKGKSSRYNHINTLYTDAGEIVEGEVFKKKGEYYCRNINKIVKRSDYRETPPCRYYLNCGGCVFQHLSYERELELKKNYAEKFLKRPPQELIPSPKIYNYRNKLEFDINNGVIGMHPRLSHRVIQIKNCYLMNEKINSRLEALFSEIEDDFYGEVRIASHDEGVVCRLYPKYQTKNIDFENLEYGVKTFNGIDYYISTDTFFQANDFIIPLWLEKIKELVKKYRGREEKLIDLFAGIGTISLYLHDLFEEIKAVENNPLSINLAHKSMKNNNIKNIKYKKIDIYNQKINEIEGNFLIVNPPRSGLNKKNISFIKEKKFNKIVYSSCNINSFSDNIKKLDNYELKEYFVFDMFPRTPHFEIVGVLIRKE